MPANHCKELRSRFSIIELRALRETAREGSLLLKINATAEKVDFRTLGIKHNIDTLKKVTPPCILHWNNDHYVVFYKIKRNRYYISDPEYRLIGHAEKEFIERWIGKNATTKNIEYISFLIEPTQN